MANKVNIIPSRFMTYNSREMDELLKEVESRSFLRDMTEDEYESLSAAEQQNGDLYLLHEADE